jgi:hypothetical protein
MEGNVSFTQCTSTGKLPACSYNCFDNCWLNTPGGGNKGNSSCVDPTAGGNQCSWIGTGSYLFIT